MKLLSIKEASELIGQCEQTVRNRLREGKLAGQLVGHGLRATWVVFTGPDGKPYQDRRKFPRQLLEGRCGACGEFGPMDVNIQRCEDCAKEYREPEPPAAAGSLQQ